MHSPATSSWVEPSPAPRARTPTLSNDDYPECLLACGECSWRGGACESSTAQPHTPLDRPGDLRAPRIGPAHHPQTVDRGRVFRHPLRFKRLGPDRPAVRRGVRARPGAAVKEGGGVGLSLRVDARSGRRVRSRSWRPGGRPGPGVEACSAGLVALGIHALRVERRGCASAWKRAGHVPKPGLKSLVDSFGWATRHPLSITLCWPAGATLRTAHGAAQGGVTDDLRVKSRHGCPSLQVRASAPATSRGKTQ